MLSSVTVSGIVILIAIVIFVFMCMKGFSPIPSGILAGALVAIVCVGGFSENFFGTFISGVVGGFGMFFLLFTGGVAFGGTLAATGASDCIGNTFVRVFGQKNAIIAIMILTIIFGMTGALPLVLMSFLSFGMMKSANLPRYIALVAVFGSTNIAMSVLPGTMGVGNIIPTFILKTDLYAAPMIGIITGVVAFILVLLFVRYLIKDAQKKGIGFDGMPKSIETVGGEAKEDQKLPSFITSFIPVIYIFAFCFIAILVFNMPSLNATVFATFSGTILLYILNRKYLRRSFKEVLSDSINNIQWNIVGVSVVFGFATLIGKTSFFGAAIGSMMEWSINPYILIVLGTFVTAALSADSIGGVAAFMGTIGAKLAAAGVNVEVIHRLSNIASGTFDTMPHGGSVILALSMFGYTHKQAYKYLIISNILIPIIYTIVALIIAMIAY